MNIIEQVEPMLDGNLARNSITKHLIEFTPGQEKAVHCEPYRAQPKMGELEKAGSDKILEMKVTELVKSERLPHFCVHQRYMAHLDFMCNI